MVATLFFLSITAGAYYLAKMIHKKVPNILFSPIILAPTVLILFLIGVGLPYESYAEDTGIFNEMLKVVTVALAIPLYKNWSFLVKYWRVIIGSLFCGTLIAVISGIVTASWFSLDRQEILSMIPRIVTMPVAINLSESIGGIVPLTVLFCVITCFAAVFMAPFILKQFSISRPLSVGMLYGFAAQALGTAKAFEIGEKEGTTASISYIITAIMTVIWASILTPIVLSIY